MARFNKGWVKAWREAAEGDLPQNIWLWGIWNWLIYNATWKPSKVLWNGNQREIPPGTVVMGLVELSSKWGCSKNTIKKWLQYLEKTQRISLEMCTRGTLVTIRNWDVYQGRDEEDCTPTARQVNADCTPAAHEVTLSKESKKEELKKEEIYIQAEAVADAPAIVEGGASLPEKIDSGLPAPKKSKFTDATRQKMRGFIAAYAKAWEAKYKSRPEGIRDKALIGKLGHWIEHVAEVRAINLVEAYLQISYRPFDENYHDLWQFFRHLNRIGSALDTGKDANSIDWAKVFGGNS